MDIEKTLLLNAPPARVWALLLDPVAMGSCVPGMQSIEVISDDEYVAQMKVKIAFISARFKLNTRIVERDEPNYLRAEGTGEDTSVASSLKQTSEMWLQETADGTTELRMKVKVDVFGRMGAFGLGVMKTKADRIWDEFGVNASARLAAPADTGASAVEQPPAATPVPAQPPASSGATEPVPPSMAQAPATPSAAPTAQQAASAGVRTGGVPPAPTPKTQVSPTHAFTASANGSRPGFWSRLFGDHKGHGSRDIRIEIRRGDLTITAQWPVEAAPECVQWLRTLDVPPVDVNRT